MIQAVRPRFLGGLLVFVVLSVALSIGLMVPASELDVSRQSISVRTQSIVWSACAEIGPTGGELGRCGWISGAILFEVGRGIVPAGPRVHNPGVSLADIVRVQPAFIRSCGGCTDALNLLVDPTSLLLVGTTLAGLGVVLRRLRRRRAIGGQ